MIPNKRAATGATIAAVLMAAGPASALEPIAILAPSDVPAGWTNYFGWSVDISGDYIVVGARYDPWYNGSGTGAAYVFRRQGRRWIEQAKLTASDPLFHAQLGYSVAIDGDVVVAGAPFWEFDACDIRTVGAAYVFRRNDAGTPDDPEDDTWPQEAKLTVSDPRRGRGLGISVAIDGDVIVVGADCGQAVAVFRQNDANWEPEASLTTSDLEPWDALGSQVCVDGDVVAVAHPGDPYPCQRFGQCYGSVYVFRRGKEGWLEEHKVLDPEVRAIGPAIALHADSLAVGAVGRVDMFRRGKEGWTQQEPVLRPDLFAGAFGSTVGLNLDVLLLGAPDDFEAGAYAGAVFLYRPKGPSWSKIVKLIPSDVQAGANFGRALALDADYSTAASGFGAYVYRICEDCGTLREFAAFQNCFQAEIDTTSRDCARLDFSGDSRVDLRDFSELSSILLGP